MRSEFSYHVVRYSPGFRPGLRDGLVFLDHDGAVYKLCNVQPKVRPKNDKGVERNIWRCFLHVAVRPIIQTATPIIASLVGFSSKQV